MHSYAYVWIWVHVSVCVWHWYAVDLLLFSSLVQLSSILGFRYCVGFFSIAFLDAFAAPKATRVCALMYVCCVCVYMCLCERVCLAKYQNYLDTNICNRKQDRLNSRLLLLTDLVVSCGWPNMSVPVSHSVNPSLPQSCPFFVFFSHAVCIPQRRFCRGVACFCCC